MRLRRELTSAVPMASAVCTVAGASVHWASSHLFALLPSARLSAVSVALALLSLAVTILLAVSFSFTLPFLGHRHCPLSASPLTVSPVYGLCRLRCCMSTDRQRILTAAYARMTSPPITATVLHPRLGAKQGALPLLAPMAPCSLAQVSAVSFYSLSCSHLCRSSPADRTLSLAIWTVSAE